jgi:transcriptional regulator with XRE-family HTH domain
MEKAEHAERLRAAMALRGFGRQVVADYVDVKVRTVTNWTTGTTMPDPTDRQLLRQLLGDYDHQGDAVERAIFASELTEDRAHTVVGFYKTKLREQRESRPGSEAAS